MNALNINFSTLSRECYRWKDWIDVKKNSLWENINSAAKHALNQLPEINHPYVKAIKATIQNHWKEVVGLITVLALLYLRNRQIQNSFEEVPRTTYPQEVYTGPQEVYTGAYNAEGKRHGFGTMVYPNGVKYEGWFENYKRHGYGKLTNADGDVIYQGYFSRGRQKISTGANGDVWELEYPDENGRIQYTFSNGRVYEAVSEFANMGKVTTTEGNVYEGGYDKDGTLQGYALVNYANGDTFEGGFKDGQYFGQGKLTYAKGPVLELEGDFEAGGDKCYGRQTNRNGDVFVGSFKGRNAVGLGRMFFADRIAYEGNYQDGKCCFSVKWTWTYKNIKPHVSPLNKALTFHEPIRSTNWMNAALFRDNNTSLANNTFEFRTVTYENGDVYEGWFLGEKKHGKGKLKLVNGDRFEGWFLNDKKETKGKITFANGTVCEGWFKKDQLEGHGKIVYAGGDMYEGQFKDGKYHGFGALTHAGQIFHGEFQEGKFLRLNPKTAVANGQEL